MATTARSTRLQVRGAGHDRPPSTNHARGSSRGDESGGTPQKTPVWTRKNSWGMLSPARASHHDVVLRLLT